MSKFCCGTAYGDNEIYCRKCGKVLEDIKDSAFVPEENIDDMPTVIIDVESVNRIAGRDTAFDAAYAQGAAAAQVPSGEDSAFGDTVVQNGARPATNQQRPVVANQQRPTAEIMQAEYVERTAQAAGAAQAAAGGEEDEKEKSGRHIGLLVASIIALTIAVLGFISMVFLNYKYTIKNDTDKYAGIADKGFHDEMEDPSFGFNTDIGGDD